MLKKLTMENCQRTPSDLTFNQNLFENCNQSTDKNIEILCRNISACLMYAVTVLGLI